MHCQHNCIMNKTAMRKVLLILPLLFLLSVSYAQKKDTGSLIDSLAFINTDSIDCNSSIYWEIVAKGKEAIPFLIEKLSDTTLTNVGHHCKKTKLNVGELAQFALTEIGSFPAFLITKIQFDVIILNEHGQGCWSFYDYFFINENKIHYQEKIREWYDKQERKYVRENISRKKQSACQKRYGIKFYYRWNG